MDLRTALPRSARDTIAGLAMAARTADKARASAAGTLGKFAYDCSMDNKLFAFTGTNAAEYLVAVTSADDDSGAEALLSRRITDKSPEEIAAFNDAITSWEAKPGSAC